MSISTFLQQSVQLARSHVSREQVYVHNIETLHVFDRDTSSYNLDHKFHWFINIAKPRHILNYFVGEFERLNVTDVSTKYNIIVGEGAPDDLGQYY